METTTASVNSALQRAHATLAKADLSEDTRRRADAGAEGDARALRAGVLGQGHRGDRLDAHPGRDLGDAALHRAGTRVPRTSAGSSTRKCPGGVHDMRMVPTRANGQPAFGLYMRGDDGDVPPLPPAGAHPRARRRRARRRVLRGVAVRAVRAARTACRPTTYRPDMSSPSDWAADSPGRRSARRGRAARARRRLHPRRRCSWSARPTSRRATPCADWDLLRLLRHMNDALAAFTEAAEIGYVDLVPVRAPATRGAELVDRLKGRACALLAAWAHHPGTGRRSPSRTGSCAPTCWPPPAPWRSPCTAGTSPRPAASTARCPRRSPSSCSTWCRWSCTTTDRPDRFAERVDVPLHARPSTRLLAALGRRTP